MRMRVGEQLGQGGKGTGGYTGRGLNGRCLDPVGPYCSAESKCGEGCFQESRFSMIGLDQVGMKAGHDRDWDRWKSTTGSKIDKAGGTRRYQWDHRDGLGNMPVLKIFDEVRFGDKVQSAVPTS